MSYYTGQGDYYSGKGDPGIFGSIWGAVKGGVSGLISGGPLGAITGGIRGAVSGARGGAAPAGPATLRLPPMATAVQAGQPGMGGIPGRLRTAGQALIPGGVEPGAGCTPGYHTNKAYSYATGAAPGTVCVKNRRMNVANPKALRRSIRRQAGFVALAKEALRGSGYTFKRTGAPTKRRRRRRH